MLKYATAYMETLGERLKRLREQRGLSASAVGRAAGIGENAVYKIESGDTKAPSFRTGLRVAAALGVSPWELLGESPPLDADAIAMPPSSSSIDAEEFEALRTFVTTQWSDTADWIRAVTDALESLGVHVSAPPVRDQSRPQRRSA